MSTGTFSPEGRIFQVEYAKKAVENSGTTIGIKCSDGIVMGVEKTLLSKMLVPGTHRRIYAIDRHVGLSMAGLVADGRQLVNRAREEALNYRKNYGCSIPPHLLAERMGQFVHYYTLYGSIRPFGTAIMLAGYDQDTKKSSLYMVEPSGVTYSYRGCALGKGQQSAKTEIEKDKLFDMTCREAMKYIAKILNTLHDEVRHPFELELSWISEETNWQHHLVPDNLRDEVNEWAIQSIKEDEMADDDDDDDE
ncbi:Proteasome subunit alpha type-3 [Phytophthora citrophthora]|uniref:Proteasome subunit alpha type-3 n=1 Tax=Phytophthora citrophthora TaxID=4793 RepID=A0AAD9LSL4_9STRA|nr:Proteasome subunit alpha type-3 [Phytophthora citrophthora]